MELDALNSFLEALFFSRHFGQPLNSQFVRYRPIFNTFLPCLVSLCFVARFWPLNHSFLHTKLPPFSREIKVSVLHLKCRTVPFTRATTVRCFVTQHKKTLVIWKTLGLYHYYKRCGNISADYKRHAKEINRIYLVRFAKFCIHIIVVNAILICLGTESVPKALLVGGTTKQNTVVVVSVVNPSQRDSEKIGT